ncbi:DNA glycosylase [Agathobaculum butyriciproducens]|uniref:DNA glycosylase n=1 Tax=Agathobaculum butyriciproducens TaxID=1628085 RepID=UPI00345E1864
MIEYVIPDFNIDQIARSGQCFRFRREEEGRYSLIAGGKWLDIEQNGEPFAFPAQKTNLRGSGAITLI